MTRPAGVSELELLVYDDLAPGPRNRAGGREAYYPRSDDRDPCHT